MNFKGAIFDLDGTLIDSMKIWDSVGAEFLLSRGITPPAHIESILKSMSFFQSTAYFVKEYSLSDTPQQIKEQMYQMVADKYKYTIPLKEGAREYLEYLSQNGIKMCIATATDKELARAALKRLGILHYFNFIKTCDEIGKGKDNPEVYLQAASELGVDKKEICIYEDVLYCARTAKKAGFKVVGVYDESSKEDSDALRVLCDQHIMSFKELYELVGGVRLKTVLTIAGSDCSGGAGIQADLKTIAVHGLYGTSVITALTAQDTTKVFEVIATNPAFVGLQLDAVFTDIYPDAIKIGMLVSKEIIEVITKKLIQYNAKNIILDPVMIATSGKVLLSHDAIQELKHKLMPRVDVITPNIAEAESLSGFSIVTTEDMLRAAQKIATFYKGALLIKGGHLQDCADDLLYHAGEATWFKATRIGAKDRHGTGCTLSSAIACNLAKGLDLKGAVSGAKEYVRGALETDTFLGRGSTPLNHSYKVQDRY